MDPTQGAASCMHQTTHPEARIDERNGDEPKIGKGTSISSSSSDSSSCDEDFFQRAGSAPLASDAMGQNGEAGSPELPINAPFSPDLSGGSPGTNNPSAPGANQSPPIQVLGRSDVPDPNRIPSSVFARTNTTTPMEWSMASNESLFSIHVGNSSFSKDHVFLMGKSQELGSYPFDVQPPIPPPPTSTPVSRGVAQGSGQPGAAVAANVEALHDALRATSEGCDDKERTSAVGAGGPQSRSTSRLSDGSVCSFAFPILTGEGRDMSIKVGPEHQPAKMEQLQKPPPQTETVGAAPGAAGNKWFSCFSSCPSCC